MTPPLKKPRLSREQTSKLLAFFTPPPPIKKPSTTPVTIPSNLPFTLVTLCQALTCISKHSSTSAPLSRLLAELQARVYSPTQLSTALFLDDESLPPLCNLVHLLRKKALHPLDLHHKNLVIRAVFELKNPEHCSCRGVHPGIQSLVLLLLGEGESGEQFLARFVRVLFAEGGNAKEGGIHRFRLARVVVDILKEQNRPDVDVLLKEWLRLAVLPRPAARGTVVGHTQGVWTPELCGLATGRKPAEYLDAGEVEAKAVLALSAAVSPATAASVFTECVTVLTNVDPRTPTFQRRVPGAISRLALLEQRILDTKKLSDVDANLKKTMECCLTGAICSVQIQANMHMMAVLLCLVRRLFLPAELTLNGDNDMIGFRQHERWLKDVIRSNEGGLAKALVKALGELVSLEPVRFLRTNHRIFSANKRHLRMFGDYLIQVRSRISDLDPLRRSDGNGNASARGSQLPVEEVRKKAEADVNRFVCEFAQSGGKIPTSLVRQMNFHRYHFRTSTLPFLLNPELVPTTEGGLNPFMDKKAFDEHRINLIKVMAFKRKDHAVTKEEAQAAIEAIKAFRHRIPVEKDNDDQPRPESSSKESVPDKNDHVAQVVEFVLKRAWEKRAVNQTNAEMTNGITAGLNTKAVSKLVDELKGILDSRKEPGSIADLAAEILQGVFNVLALELPDEDKQLSADEIYEWCQSWWHGFGAILRTFFAKVLGHDNLRILQRQTQCHLFALSCMRLQALKPSMAIGMAHVVSVMALLTGDASLTDLCYVPQPQATNFQRLFVRTVFEYLSLRDAENVKGSVRFALHSLCALKVAKDGGSWFTEQVEMENNPDDFSDETDIRDGCGSILHRFFIRPLLSLLQWVLTVPWRLLAENESEQRDYMNGTDSCDAENILLSTTRVLSSERFYINEKHSLREWLKTEYRCGWGRAKAVRKALGGFSRTGLQSSEIIGEACLFLVVTSSQTRNNADWIWQGILLFADESMSTEKQRSTDSSTVTASLSEILRSGVERYGVDIGFRVFFMLSLTSHGYFYNTDFAQADAYVAELLIPWFWPLPTRCLKYLLRSLDKCLVSPVYAEGSCKSELYLMANIIMHGDSFFAELEDWNLRCTPIRALVKKVKKARKSISIIIDQRGMSHDRSSQVPVAVSNLITSASEFVGMSLIMHFISKCIDSGRHIDAYMQAFAGVLSFLLSCADSISVVDVIDTAICLAAFAPYTHRFVETDEHEGAIRAMEIILPKLVEERMRLPGVPVPLWARENQEGKLVNEYGCGNLFLGWLGQLGQASNGSGGATAGHLTSSLAVAVSQGTIFVTIKDVSKETLSLFLSSLDTATITSVLIPNILTVYTTLTGDMADFANEKLSETTKERLVMYRKPLSKKLLETVCHIFSMLESVSMDLSTKEYMHRILQKFPDRAEEIKMYLRNYHKHMV